MDIRVTSKEFRPGEVLDGFATGRRDIGAVVSFTGLVRDTGGVARMVIEHYPGMTEKAITAYAAKAVKRFELEECLVIHRYGDIAAGAPIMMVITASRHRVNAFEAAQYLMDYLKSRAPFWKKEYTKDGAQWVEAKTEDEDALSRW
ncbi:MAG: molybdenum cofactor biosynthesis protein MoaE [Maritimibacter sp.]